MTRREFTKSSVTASAAAFIPTTFAIGQSGSVLNKLKVACVGCGHMGAPATNEAAAENLVALCDVDWRESGPGLKDNCAAAKAAEYNDAPRFTDYREMLDKLGHQIDVVLISTPDHTHFPIAMACMEAGKHVFVQKL